jgi:hypothetical protein
MGLALMRIAVLAHCVFRFKVNASSWMKGEHRQVRGIQEKLISYFFDQAAGGFWWTRRDGP